MADLTKAKTVVKEKLLGTDQTEELNLSAQSKSTFEKNSRKDADTGELFMNEEDFINAIAPVTEDYVSDLPPARFTAQLTQHLSRAID